MPRPIQYKTPFEYPVYVFAHVVAQLIGWRTERVSNLWRKHGIVTKVGHYVATTPEKLQMLWPEQWDAVLDKLESGETEDWPGYDKRARKFRKKMSSK